jgi:hypothetical protein
LRKALSGCCPVVPFFEFICNECPSQVFEYMKAIICISRTKYKRISLIVIHLGMYDKKTVQFPEGPWRWISFWRMRAERWAPIAVALEFC